MQYLSGKKSPSFVVTQGYTTVTQTNRGPVTEQTLPIIVRFTALTQPLPLKNAPFKDGLAWGTLTTADAAEKIRRQGQGFYDPETKDDITEKSLDEFFAGHLHRDRIFVMVDKRGKVITRADSKGSIQEGFHCEYCDQDLDTAQAVKNHNRSPAHLKAVEVDEEANRVLAATG